ncbi:MULTISPECIES: DUF6044 family protein [unclassified Sporolactobacillus]|uniref:DUF6044 family protein n=1 Tax=unclassified Sporolactobacillus TaxID=2628533 RepID=UPI002367F32E|nr:DUF6044 family protein [Sporolactobacillus sp. CQH2019]MDD9148477.1 DUF6044 family protein [Sporolactobacillus sp. CQH2019]
MNQQLNSGNQRHAGPAFKEKRALILAALLIAVYLSPLFILGENAHIRVQDNLDSNVAWYQVLNRSGELFGSINAGIPQVINGELSRNAFDSQFSGIVWLHVLFPSMLAFSLSQAIVCVFAFLGMYLLLRDYCVKSADAYPVRVLGSLAFALTPFWPSGMLSTMGMPLALWAFLNIRARKGTWREWLIFSLLPFYSSFVLGFFFFLTAMLFLWLRDWIVKRKANLLFLGSIAFMTALYLLLDYRLVASLLFPGPPTNRNEFLESTGSLYSTAKLALENFILGHNQVMTVHEFVILPFTGVVLWQMIRNGGGGKRLRKWFVCLLVINILLSVWFAFWFYKGWAPLKEKISILTTFNFSRYHYLHPLFIYLMFAVGAAILWKMGNKWRRFVRICFVLQLAVLFYYNPEIEFHGEPTFKQFYAVQQFHDIAAFIGKPQSDYRIASIGLHPAIAQYNGFYTLDTYNNFYPLSYKHTFRKIIAKELDKNKEIKSYFDNWGGRCYLFTAELGKNYEFRKGSAVKIHHLQLNINAFKKLGGRYILSSVPIMNADQDGLRFLKSFNNSASAWTIYLYEAK